MATRQWLGIAPARTDVWTLTVGGTVEIGDKFIVAFGGIEVLSVSATSTSTTTTASEIATAWNASTHPYLTGVTASPSGAVVTLTADVAGWPFLPTAITRESNDAAADSQTFVASNTVVATGPNFASNAMNWSGGTLPVSTDTVVFRDSAVNCCWGLNQSAILLAKLEIHQSYLGRIGLDSAKYATTADAATTVTGAVEYRDIYLRYGGSASHTSIFEVGLNDSQSTPAGSGRIMLDTGTNGVTVVVYNTAAAASETGRPAVRLKTSSSNAASRLVVKSAPGGVGIAIDKAGETSTINLVTIQDESTASRVFLGNGVTLTRWSQYGGNNVCRFGANDPDIETYGGVLLIDGTFRVDSLDVWDGAVTANNVPTSGNAVTTLTTFKGTCDFTKDGRARSLGTWNIGKGGGGVEFDPAVVTVGAISTTFSSHGLPGPLRVTSDI